MLLTIKQAAAELAVSESTVKRLLKRGDLRRVRIGTAVRVDEADLGAFLRKAKGEDDGGTPKMISPGQQSAYHAKCGTLARLIKDSKVTKETVQARAMRKASQMFGRTIQSSSELGYAEAAGLLDFLDGKVNDARAGQT